MPTVCCSEKHGDRTRLQPFDHVWVAFLKVLAGVSGRQMALSRSLRPVTPVKALVEIYGATFSCDGVETEGEQICCTGSVFGILQSFVNTASWLAGLVTQCANVTNLQADCASVILAFPGSVFEALEAGLDSVSACQDQAQMVLDSSRRLLKNRGWSERFGDWTSPVLPAPKRELKPGLGSPDEKQDAAWCQVDVTQAAVYFAQALACDQVDVCSGRHVLLIFVGPPSD